MRDRVLYLLSSLVLLVACTTITPEDRRANLHDWYDCLTDHNRDYRAWIKHCS